MPRLIADMDAADYLAWKVREEMLSGDHLEPPSEKELSDKFRKIILERPLAASPGPSELVEHPNPETQPARDRGNIEQIVKALQEALHSYHCTYTVYDADPESGLSLYDKLGPEELDLLEDYLLGAIEDVPRSPMESVPVSVLRELEALADDWKKKAHDAVPPEYAARAMHYKYLKGDNYAAGQDDCADDLRALITRHRGKS